MIKNDCSEIVKKEFDFGWKAGHSIYEADRLALEYQKGDTLALTHNGTTIMRTRRALRS
jgi:hypothetical protein